MTDPAIIEAAELALFKTNFYAAPLTVEIIVAAVTPMIEAAALERAAKLVDDDDHYLSSTHGRLLAAAIRALKQN